MKRIWLLILGICVIGLAVPSTALAGKGDKRAERKSAKQANQPTRLNIARFDRNGNGVLDPDEKDAVRKLFATLAAFDTNKDGKLDENELAAVQPTKPLAKRKKQAQ